MNFVRLGRDPFAVFVITSFLRYFADIDFGVEIGGEGHAVVSGVAVHDVEVVDLVEMVLGGIGGEDRRHARIEPAAENRRESLFAETILIGPLPRIFEMRFVPWLVVGRIEVIDAAFQAGVHDREILIGKGHVDDDIGTEGAEEFAQFGNAVGIDLSGLYAAAADRRRNGVALRLGAAGQHHVRKDWIGRHLLRYDRTDAACADDQSSTHIIYRF